jgi:hypothetical protein
MRSCRQQQFDRLLGESRWVITDNTLIEQKIPARMKLDVISSGSLADSPRSGAPYIW